MGEVYRATNTKLGKLGRIRINCIDWPMKTGYSVIMTATEIAVEKVKKLSERQAEMVLDSLDELAASAGPSASDLMRLPIARRRAILQAQAAKVDALYRTDASLICEDAEAPLPYA